MPKKISKRKISEHEARHIFGDAIAIIELGTKEIYEKAKIGFEVHENKGSAYCYFKPEELAVKTSALASLAPISVAGERLLDLILAEQWDTLVDLGDISSKDLRNASNWSKDHEGSGIKFAKVAMGVYYLEESLGVGRFQKLCGIMRSLQEEGLNNTEYPLSDFVPYKAAKAAHKKAKEFVEGKTIPTFYTRLRTGNPMDPYINIPIKD